ncbi:MAG: hypothetical protein LBJ46_01245, partial [Planctomycetota bacterium]|nr:hypothetical protein [Planctomycetota bacterium]
MVFEGPRRFSRRISFINMQIIAGSKLKFPMTGRGALLSLVAGEVWTAIRAELKQHISDVVFDQWFSGAEIMACKGDMVELGVQNRFFKSRIETAYLDVLTKAVSAALDCPAHVSVSVSPRLLARFRKAQEAACRQ